MKDRPATLEAYIDRCTRNRLLVKELPAFLAKTEEEQDEVLEEWLAVYIEELEAEALAAQDAADAANAKLAVLR